MKEVKKEKLKRKKRMDKRRRTKEGNVKEKHEEEILIMDMKKEEKNIGEKNRTMKKQDNE